MKKKKKGIIILSIVAAIVVLGVIGYTQMRAGIEKMGKTTYAVVDVQRGDVSVKVKGVGTAEPLYDNTVYAGFAGTVKEVFAEDGDIVKADDIIAVFESSALETQRDTLQTSLDEADAAIMTLRSTKGSKTVVAPVKGTVKAVYGEVGELVDAVMERYGALALISPDELMEAVLDGVDGLLPGDKVTVTADSISAQGTVYSIREGKVKIHFSDEGFDEGSTVTVTGDNGQSIGSAEAVVANPVMVTARGGTIDKVHKRTGSEVSRGGKLFSLEGEVLSSALYAQIDARRNTREELDKVLGDIDSLTVRAGTDGVISGLDLGENQAVVEGAALFSIKSSSQLKLDVEIDETDIANIELGEEATVTFDALKGETYTAKVVKINPIGVSQNNVAKYTVTLSLGNVSGLMLGMGADVEIISQHAKNVLLIPIEAIQIVGDEKFVVLEADIDESLDATPATHKVETGISDGVYIEVRQGLNEGDRVAVPQIKSVNIQQQMMGFRPGSGSTQRSEEQ